MPDRSAPRRNQDGPRVAVVGCGIWGRNHVRNYAELGALAAIVDRDRAVAEEHAAKHGVPARAIDEVLGDPDIEGLVLALPPSRNHDLGTRALVRGKHLFVEKPMAMDLAEAEDLCERAERLDRRLMVGHILQYHPAFLALAALLREGRLGRLLSVISTRLDFGRIRREEDALWALAPHDVSMILGLVGSEPHRVTADGGYHTHATIADTTTVGLDFADSVRAEIRVSWLHPFKEQRLVVVGTDALAVFDDREPWERKLAVYDHRLVDRGGVPFAMKAEPRFMAVDPGEPLKEECRHFLACIRSGARPRTDGREGLRVLKVLQRASAALSDSRPGGGTS